MIQRLYDEIVAFEACNDQEKQDQMVMLEYLHNFDNILTRDNHFAHFTASPWIINQDATKVLMCYHNIFRSWSWCGGHADGEVDLLQVALREGKEETGILHLEPFDGKILALDILPVPPHVKNNAFVSAHVHLNFAYLCIGDDRDMLQVKEDENSDIDWISIHDIMEKVTEEDMKVVYAKLIKKAESVLL